MPMMRPKPSQRGQAPSGLLNVKSCSLGSSNAMPSASNRFEKSWSVDEPSGAKTRRVQVPEPSKNAVCTESARRLSVAVSEVAERRSMTRLTVLASMVAMVSASRRTKLSPKAMRLNPCLSSMARWSAMVRSGGTLTAASSATLVPSGSCAKKLTTSPTVCRLTSVPDMGENVRPTREKSSFR